MPTSRFLTIAFAVTEAGPNAAAGDLFTAMELGEALAARFGWTVEYRSKGAGWYDLDGVDVLVAMVDDYKLTLIKGASPALVRVAWARNWFERWCDQAWIAGYDLVLASSCIAASFMSEKVGKLARVMRIATNPARFNVLNRAAAPTLDYVFTGNYWQAERDIATALLHLPQRYRGAVYGLHWDNLPPLAHLARGFVPYLHLNDVYRQSTIVIDDANHVTKSWGAANSRVFDALAAGCLVITNSDTVSQEVFGGLLPVYHSPAELEKQLAHYLADPAARLALQSTLREQVLSQHLYAHRAIEFGLHLRRVRKEDKADLPPPSHNRQAVDIRHISVKVATSPARYLGAWPSVSFVVPLYNQLQHSQAMLASLQASLPNGLEFEIILTDDASTDDTPAWLKSLQDPCIKTVLNKQNRGYAANNNSGVVTARGEILCLLNNDLLFEPGWLEPMLGTLLDQTLGAGIVGNVQRRVATSEVDHAGVCINYKAQLEHIRELVPSDGQCVQTIATTGACMLIRTVDFRAVGGFDKQYVNGAEDVDLCFKIRQQGQRVYVARDSCVLHHVSLSRGAPSIIDERNSQRLFGRWRPQIKQELTRVWLHRLKSGWLEHSDELRGLFEPEILKTPQLAALLAAEEMIARQEQRWAKLLGGVVFET